MLKNKSSTLSIVIWLSLVMCFVPACSAEPVNTGSEDSKDYLTAGEQNIRAWRQMKFGLFIHWGPVSLKGTEIGWSRGGERHL